MTQSVENLTLAGTTAIVTGASRGFGNAIAAAFAAADVKVVGVARSRARLEGDHFTSVAADAADPEVANRLVDEHQPQTLVLCAGATPTMSPLHEQTWESFSQTWNVDVAQAFNWCRAALRRPLAPGSTVIVMSSGAALNGSPLSGGYAGAKAAVKFVADYAAIESERAGLGIRFVSVLPRLTPATELGAKAVAAYADRQGVDVDAFLEAAGPALTAEQVGRSVLELANGGRDGSYLLTAAGLSTIN
ncbi:SDR family oxidoreductase [Mycobacterium sp.]|uniref:SDR family NAD(P)-dependent oxidoreductase n=1 Tax=Mycobacterium sp. TaxID=1785 RepID=UPI0025D06C8D|nr:SDR family oxidoreductase [Mycobacterium sp.]